MIGCGDTSAGSITTAGQSQLWRFDATASSVVTLTITETTDWGGSLGANDARLTLFDPSGTQIDEFDSNQQHELTLPQTGTYLIRISANNLVATGGYDLSLACS